MRFRDWFPYWIPPAWAFPWIPFKSERHTLFTRLSPEECRSRLESEVVPALWVIMRAARPGLDGPFVWGSVSRRGFRLRLLSPELGFLPPCMIFQAEATGSFSTAAGGTEVTVVLATSLVVAVAEALLFSLGLVLMWSQPGVSFLLLLLMAIFHVFGVHCLADGAFELHEWLETTLSATEHGAHRHHR